MDKGLIHGFLFQDLKMAFDTDDNKILISKLEKYGIRGTALYLFQSVATLAVMQVMQCMTKNFLRNVLKSVL